MKVTVSFRNMWEDAVFPDAVVVVGNSGDLTVYKGDNALGPIRLSNVLAVYPHEMWAAVNTG